MLRLVILPQQAKRKCQKLALLLFKRVYFLFLELLQFQHLAGRHLNFYCIPFYQKERRIYEFDTKQSQMENLR